MIMSPSGSSLYLISGQSGPCCGILTHILEVDEEIGEPGCTCAIIHLGKHHYHPHIDPPSCTDKPWHHLPTYHSSTIAHMQS